MFTPEKIGTFRRNTMLSYPGLKKNTGSSEVYYNVIGKATLLKKFGHGTLISSSCSQALNKIMPIKENLEWVPFDSLTTILTWPIYSNLSPTATGRFKA